MTWTDTDFSLHMAFWDSQGIENSIPIRFRNLSDIFRILAELDDSYPILTGTTAKNALMTGGLLEDHDDDLVVLRKHVAEIVSAAQKLGFTLIRRDEKLFSLYRHHCYVDFHIVEHFTQSRYKYTAFLGERVSVDRTRPQVERSTGGLRRLRKILKILFVSLEDKGLFQTIKSVKKQIVRNSREYSGKRKLKSAQDLTFDQFLDLSFEPKSSLNWHVRKPQLEVIAQPGQSIREMLASLSGAGGMQYLEKAMLHPTFKHVCSPENLCRDYWADGNSFFIYPMLLGFRHAWPGYSAASLISSTIGSGVMGLNSLKLLPAMTDSEASVFLEKNPIEIRNGAVVSGKHRAAAMIGRILRGEPYLQMKAIKVS